jgi:hypothetical protein
MTGKSMVSVLFVVALVATFGLAGPALAGSSEPPDPPGPTMKTLEEVEPRIPITQSDIPLTIDKPGSYYLTGNLILASGKHPLDIAIFILSDDVTIDLMGYRLVGPGAGTGIMSNNTQRSVEIRNGTVRGFGYGIRVSAQTSEGFRIINMRALYNTNDGIHIQGRQHLIKNCLALQNGGDGIRAQAYSVVVENTARGNGGDGIEAGFSAVVANTASENGSHGLHGSGSVVGNTAYGNGLDGLYVGVGSVKNNSSIWNKRRGIELAGKSLVDGNAAYNNNQGGLVPNNFKVNIGPCATCVFGTNYPQ